jgi:hypothetical protein
MIAAFTGTRKGATEAQLKTLRAMLIKQKVTTLHHGDCMGADEQAHLIAVELGLRTVAHPPTNPKLRAYCIADEVREPLPYITRNHNMVDESGILFATPWESYEIKRSGTWSTVRYAKKTSVPEFVILHDGEVMK